MTESDDLIFVRRCQNGDRKAFEVLVDRYEKKMFNVALRMTRSYSDAEDIAQGTFLKAYEKIGTFDERYKFFSWLYRIAVNESLNHINQRKQNQDLSEDIVAEEKSPEDVYDDEQTSKRVEDALMELKADHRAVIILKHMQGLSYGEISEILGIPEKKVKSRLFTARMMLKEVLLARGLVRQ